MTSSLILIGIGRAGCSMAYGISRAFGDSMRYILCDTDAASARENSPFILLGGDRLSGHGSGGDIGQAKLAAEDSLHIMEKSLEGVRLAIITTALGGGTGSGATQEVLKYLNKRDIPSIVFATLPFAFEGEDRMRRALGAISSIEYEAGASIIIPLDKLIGDTDQMNNAMDRAVDTMASGITLFWRLLQKPGYIRLDTERVRKIISEAGKGRFATITVQGFSRASEAISAFRRTELLAGASGPVKSILVGILAGEDLRLSEVNTIAKGVRAAFGENAAFDLATVNDENTFSGRLSVVVMLFESDTTPTDEQEVVAKPKGRRRKRDVNPLAINQNGRGRFTKAEPTIYRGENLDIPTYIRRDIHLGTL